ncbi:prepilin-type N-terminal cleavage/methylation domain-containing protein, partial [Exiguobacterium sp.]|nr:hypothetical protein [Exiguobacterium sp.]
MQREQGGFSLIEVLVSI